MRNGFSLELQESRGSRQQPYRDVALVEEDNANPTERIP